MRQEQEDPALAMAMANIVILFLSSTLYKFPGKYNPDAPFVATDAIAKWSFIEHTSTL